MIAASMDLLSAGDAPVVPSVAELLLSGSQAVTVPEKGGTSPVYSPLSCTSSDSGVLSSLTEEDQFLAGLFGAEFPLLSESATSQPFLSEPDQSIAPFLNPRPPAGAMLAEEFADSPPPSESGENLKVNESQLERNRKNAEAARQNRIKKKKHMEDLEKERSGLKTENVVLKTKCGELEATVRRLAAEVRYLRSVLANESTLSSLIQNIPDTPGVSLTSSFSRKRPLKDSVNNSGSDRRVKKSKTGSEEPVTGGVCLHVSKNVVSLEFCATCSQQAAQAVQD